MRKWNSLQTLQDVKNSRSVFREPQRPEAITGKPTTYSDLMALRLFHKALAQHTRLEQLETKLSISPCEGEFDLTHRQTVAYFLHQNAGSEDNRRRAMNIWTCGTHHVVARDGDEHKLLRYFCRDRSCPDCQKRCAQVKYKKIEARVEKMRKPKMITLTLKADGQSLQTRLDRLYKSFRTLRRMQLWKQTVKGGLYVTEIKVNKLTDSWNVHIHCIVDSNYLDKVWLSEQWLRITGDSYIVDIKKVRKQHIGYLAKYASKGSDGTMHPAHQIEMMDALKGRRLCGTFGNVEPFGADDPESKYEILGTLEQFLTRARAGDLEALAILEECVGINNDS